MEQVSDVEIPLDPDVFLRTLVREPATSLESVIGLEEASGYVSLVGQAVGTQIDEMYIARGDAGCRVAVHLVPDVDVETGSGREYFGDRAVAP
ncbi:hypothetical protein [Streptomyces sp. NPDC002763]|uniref:hypothetical protein n=1 Tax=Streptomyces sp. NPDC002763 TaxID=3154427 RepID=UPI00331F52C0